MNNADGDGKYVKKIKFTSKDTNLAENERALGMCPICKTDRYLSPNMTFLINPECYHKICESCVDRIFSLGPAPCPYPKCGKILRKNRFKKQLFEDVKVEKEIDIRKRIAGVYNMTEEDFDDLDSYNQYLEEVEELIFKLNNEIDLEQTESQVKRYEGDHKIEIIERNMKESKRNSDLKKYNEAVETLKQEKLSIQRQMEMEDEVYKKKEDEELLDKLSTSNADSNEIVQQIQSSLLKRTSVRKRQLQQIRNQLDEQFNLYNPLAKDASETTVTPFTPFNGDRDLNKEFTILPIPQDVGKFYEIDSKDSDSYYEPFISRLAKNKDYLAAGWRLQSAVERSLDQAFKGLGCFFISSEKV